MKYLAATCLVLSLSACSSRPTSDEIENTVPDCARSDEQIKMLKQEMITTQERVAAGVQSVVPSAAVLNLLAGRWETNADLASGEYEEALNAKIEEIQTTCGA